jgi:hypothetical protein
MNLIKVYYMHVWKYHSETVQFMLIKITSKYNMIFITRESMSKVESKEMYKEGKFN